MKAVDSAGLGRLPDAPTFFWVEGDLGTTWARRFGAQWEGLGTSLV